MGFLGGLWRLLSRSFLLTAVAIIIPVFIVHPILRYFYPAPESTLEQASSPLLNLQEIVAHRENLERMEKELQGYLSPEGRNDIMKLIEEIGRVKEDMITYYVEIVQEFGNGKKERGVEDYKNSKQKLQKLIQNIDANKYSALFSLENRVSTLTNAKAIEDLRENFDISRTFGIVLDSGEIDLDEKDTSLSEKNCLSVLNKLVGFFQEAKDLTDTITKLAKEIETRHENGVSVEDLNVAEQIDHYDTESNRLKHEIDAVLNDNLYDISRTSEYVSSAINRVQQYFTTLQSEFNMDLVTNIEFYNVFSSAGQGDYVQEHAKFDGIPSKKQEL